MTIDEVISKMNQKIAEVKAVAEAKRPLVSPEDQAKIDEIVEKTIKVVNDASFKIRDTLNGINADEVSISQFLDRVSKKCADACDYTIKRIQSMANDPAQMERLKEAKKSIDDSFNSLMDNEDVKSVIDAVRSTSSNIAKNVNDYWNRPETQEEVRKTKKAALNIITKCYDSLYNLLNDEEDHTN